jgi:hypothetical protein
VRKIRITRVDYPDGETHYVLLESSNQENSKNSKIFDKDGIKKISKLDAAKQLLIARE